MYFHRGADPKFLPEHNETLLRLKIDANGPGTILHDFEVFLNILKEEPFPLTPSGQLPLNVLLKINARLAHPIQLGLKRPQPKSYPHIQGLYLLLRASGLTYPDESGKKPALLLEDAIYNQWATLNSTERYFNLLETWLLRGKPQILGEYDSPFDIVPENFRRSASYYMDIPSEGLAVAGNRNAETELMYGPGWHILGLLHLFGLIEVEDDLPEPGQGWHIKTIRRTALGDSLLVLLYTGFFEEMANIFALENKGEGPVGTLQPILQPYFAAWKNNLALPEWAFREGTYIFKVSLAWVWGRITIGARESLDDLAASIIASVNFDSDHLYEFRYRNRFGAIETVSHPFLEDSQRYTDEVLVGHIPIHTGQTMTFLFDFGDNWEFNVALEQIDPTGTVKKTGILEKHGKPPQQYPDWTG